MSTPTTGRFPGRDGTELAYRELGAGRPLVLLHGMFGSGALWTGHGLARMLADRGHRVIAPDLRAHGDSAAPRDPAAYPPDVLADDGLALLDALDLGDYDLGGYSLGARIAVRMLVRGARPARAVVGAQGLQHVTAHREVNGIHRAVLAALADDRPLPEGSVETSMADWIRRSGGDPVALCHVLDSLVPTDPELLADVTVPTLVIVGRDDPRRATTRDLADRLPAARFVEVPGDHLTALDEPRFAEEVAASLA